MTVLADRTIAALRSEHDRLAGLAGSATTEQLAAGSGAAEWTVAQALSHLGSGAEIMLAGLHGAMNGAPPPEDFNRGVWARWDAATPEQQRDWFVEHDESIVSALEDLTDEQRASVRIPIFFLPAPLTIAGFTGMRLNEAANHGWDVAVAFADDAAISEDTARVALEQFATELGFILGFAAKPDTLGRSVTMAVRARDEALSIGERVQFVAAGEDVTATFDGPAESLLRLINGRLTPGRTPDGVSVTGDVTLDELRAVFPGF